MKTYLTHDNGGRPFQVTVDDKTVTVTRYLDPNILRDLEQMKEQLAAANAKAAKTVSRSRSKSRSRARSRSRSVSRHRRKLFAPSASLIKRVQATIDTINNFRPLVWHNCDQIIIGKSPYNEITETSGGAGAWANGNTVLIKKGADYVLIGSSIIQFRTPAEITHYWSSVGNNDVAYVHFVDADGAVYSLPGSRVVQTQMKPEADKTILREYKSGARSAWMDVHQAFQSKSSEILWKAKLIPTKILADRL